MKKVKLLLFTAFVLLGFTVLAQPYPEVTWRFANPTVIPGDTFQFDVELKASFAGTYHSSTQIYFDYSAAAFGTTIVENNRIVYEKLALMDGLVFGAAKYNVVNDADNTPTRYAIVFESAFVVANPTFMNEVTTDFQGFMRFKIKIQNMAEVAGIQFVANVGGVGLMDYGQFYVDATHPAETPYGVPPNYAGYYDNNLLNVPFITPGVINGTVEDNSTMLGIGGATVTAGSYSTITAADGSYSISLPAGTYDVTASYDCYMSQTVPGVVVTDGSTTTVDFSLIPTPYGTISGTVTDFYTTLGIDGVTVTAGAYSTTTAADGTYTLTNMMPGTYDVLFTNPAYFNVTIPGVIVACGQSYIVNAVMSPVASSGTIAGIVTDAVTTNPVAGATVMAGMYSTISLVDGSYSLSLPAGTYDVIATAGCYTTGNFAGISVTPGNTTTLDIALQPNPYGNLTGMVYDDFLMTPVEGALVTAGAYSTTTAANGTYTLPNMLQGTYDVTASHPDYTPTTINGVVITCDQTTTQDIGIHPLVIPTPVVSWRFANQQIVNDSLQFDVELKCNIPGTYHTSTQIYFDYNTTAFGQNIVANNKVSYSRLALLDGTIGGGPYKYDIVNDADNTPSRYAIVFESVMTTPDPTFLNEVTTGWQGFMRFQIKITDANNVAGVAFVPDMLGGTIGLMNGGQYYVDATHLDETPYGDPPAYAGNYINDLLGYWLTTTGTISGIVTDAVSLSPIAGATVTAGSFTTTTDANGLYSMLVPSGSYNVSASYGCYYTQTLSGIVPPNGTLNLAFTLDPWTTGTLTGTVTNSTNGNPISGATVNVSGFNGTTNASGVYTINNIPQGTYTATCSAPNFINGTAQVTINCGGATTTQNFALTPSFGKISGTVTSASGTPIVGATVTTTPGNYFAITITGGTYLIENIPPGTYSVTASATGYQPGTVQNVVVNPGVTTTGVNFELEPLAPPTNVDFTVTNCNDVVISWDPPGGGSSGAILVVDRDGSATGGYQDAWANVQAALDANSLTYTYYEVADLTLNGPDLATMQAHDIIIWLSGEAWGYYGDDCMTATDENNVGTFLDGGGRLFFSGMDYLYASYGGAGNLTAGTFPYDYLGLRTVTQDNWSIFTPDVASVSGVAGSLAAGMTFTAQDIYSAKDGLYIDLISNHVGQGLFNITSPAPAGIGAIQYSTANFKTVFTTVDFSAIVEANMRTQLMAAIIGWFGSDYAGDDLTGYKVYRDGTLLGTTTNEQYPDNDVPVGSHTYCVTAVYTPGGESSQACTDPVIVDNCMPPTNLHLDTYVPLSGDAKLIWEAPGSGSGEWIHWDDEASAGGNSIGLTSGGSFYIASHWLGSDLTGYVGQFLTKVKFFAGDYTGPTFVIKVWKGANAGTLVLTQNVPTVTYNAWNEVDLTTPVLIENGELWFGYQVTHTASQYPAGTDLGPAVANKGDMISLDGTSWESMSISYGLDYNWSMEGFVSPTDDGKSLAQPLGYNNEPVQNSGWLDVKPNMNPAQDDAKGLTGFNVYHRNPGEQYSLLASVPSNQTTYTHVDAYLTGLINAYVVTATYTNGESVYSNEVIINFTSVPESLEGKISIYPNPATDFINIKSEIGVNRIMITDALGKVVYNNEMNDEDFIRINTTQYQQGMYNIQVWTDEGTARTKFIVR